MTPRGFSLLCVFLVSFLDVSVTMDHNDDIIDTSGNMSDHLVIESTEDALMEYGETDMDKGTNNNGSSFEIALEADDENSNKNTEDLEHLNRNMVQAVFQVSGKATTLTYLDSGYDAFGNITKYTICLRFKMLNGASPATLFSYTDGVAFEELNIAIKFPEHDLLVVCCYYHVHHYFDVPVQLFRWHHMCVSVDLRGDTLKVFFDGEVFETTAGRPESEVDKDTLTIKGHGRFVIGQNINPDYDDDGWDVTQSYHGNIADFYFYIDTLTMEEMANFTTCKIYNITSPKPLYKFDHNMTGMKVKGDITVGDVQMIEACHQRDGHLTLFSEKVIWDESYARCKLFSGTMAVPKDKEENDYVTETFLVFDEECTQGWAALFWLGLIGNISAQLWYNAKDYSVVTWGNWLESWEYPTEKYPCMTSGASSNLAYWWYNADCSTLTCTICNFTQVPVMRIRGLCKESKFDRIYYLYGYHQTRPVFEGMFFSRILWLNDTWVIQNRRDDEIVIAHMVEKRHKGYPLGLAVWESKGDGCGQDKPNYMLTLCGKNDFTCSDGSCVDIAKRCDLQTDCKDNSDELNCRVFELPPGYSADLPPPSLDGSPLNLEIDVTMTSVRKFDLVGFMVEVDVSQTITWKDARLTFANLRKGYFSNIAKVTDDLWRPMIRIQDGSESPTDVTVRSNVFQVNREGPPLEDDDTRTGEDRLYSGAKHSLRILEIYTVGFMCQFSLQMYPFDIQSCSISFNVTNMQDFVLKNGGITYTGERALLEYQLLDETMTSLDDAQSVKLSLRFKNRYGYYIGNSIIPSLFMIVISYTTFLFDLDDFQDRIIISLTSLLVLASLFSQTSQSIPKTAYLKLIDVWYVTMIAIDFLITIFLVFVETLRLRKLVNDRVFQVSPTGVSNGGLKLLGKRDWATMANQTAVVLFPVAIVMFCIIFFMLGFLEFYIEY